MRDRLKRLIEEYGRIAILTYFAIFALVIAGSLIAIKAGMRLEGVAEGAGALAAAWIMAKLTQPFRILATLGLTPIIAAILRRRSAPRSASPARPDAPSPTPEPPH